MKTFNAPLLFRVEREAAGMQEVEGRAGLAAATLPWWARVRIAHRVEIAFPKEPVHFMNYCSHCGCVLVPEYTARNKFLDLCLRCDNKNRSSQGGN